MNLAWITRLDHKEIDYRGPDEWIWQPSLLATDDGETYSIQGGQRNAGLWAIQRKAEC